MGRALGRLVLEVGAVREVLEDALLEHAPNDTRRARDASARLLSSLLTTFTSANRV
jgi:hypothetical protein